MLFRESGESTSSSVDMEEYSSSGCSLASSESYCTRAFEKRIKLLLEPVSVDDGDSPKRTEFLNVMGLEGSETTENNKNRKPGIFDLGTEEGQVSCFNYDNGLEWGSLEPKPEGATQPDVQFYEYPTSEYFKTHPPKQVVVDETSGEGGSTSSHHHHGTKMFIGGLRFEVVQVGRHLISWIFEVGCGVRLPPSSILVHRKAKGGRSGSPTGCASVFVPSETDVELLLAMNQRIFCGEKGVYVSSSVERMAELIASKTVLDVGEGRARGPTHPVIIERAYGAAGHNAARSRSSTNVTVAQETVSNSLQGVPSVAACSSASSFQSSLSIPVGANTPASGPVQPGRSRLLVPSKEPIYHKYPGKAEAEKLLQFTQAELQRPCNVFVGGFSAEADGEFVAWVFSLMNVPVHPDNVTLYVDSQSGEKDGCVLVRMEKQEVSKATAWNKRVLCDAQGVCFASSQREVLALVAARDKVSGPARPLLIKRKDGDRSVPKTTVPVPGGPPPPFPGAWDNPPLSMGSWQPSSSPARPPPPPYMQNVIIGNQTYQVPMGASIQLQLVPVITGPNVASGGAVPLQPTPVPMYQTIPFFSSPPTLR